MHLLKMQRWVNKNLTKVIFTFVLLVSSVSCQVITNTPAARNTTFTPESTSNVLSPRFSETPTSIKPPYSQGWIEDTVNRASIPWFYDDTALVWSKKGNNLVYRDGFSLLSVSAGDWSRIKSLHRFGSGESKTDSYTIDSTSLGLSPDEYAVGFTLMKVLDPQKAVRLMATINLTTDEVTILSQTPARFVDWCDENLILALSNGVYKFYNPTSQQWRELPAEVRSAYSARCWPAHHSLLLGLENETVALMNLDTYEIHYLPYLTWKGVMQAGVIGSKGFWVPLVGSPDGRYVAWLTNEDPPSYTNFSVKLYDVISSVTLTITGSGTMNGLSSLTWSHGSDQLAFIMKQGEIDGVIKVLHLK